MIITKHGEQTCKTCMFFSGNSQCRKYAPRRIPSCSGGLFFAAFGFMMGGTSSGFPTVEPDDWCGEHSQLNDTK